MINFILVIVIVLIVGGAIVYIRKEKKRGVRCVGCPDGGTCGGNCSGCGSGQIDGNCKHSVNEDGKE